MARGFTQYLVTKMLEHLFCGVAYTAPTSLSLRLYKSDPLNLATPSTVEVDATVDDTAYAPQTVTFAIGTYIDEGAKLDAPSGITFPAVVYGSGAAAYDVTHYGVTDQGGVLLCSAPFPSTQNRAVGDPLVFSDQSVRIFLPWAASPAFSGLSYYSARKILGHVFCATAFTPPSGLKIKLHTEDSLIYFDAGGSYSEVDGTIDDAYAHQNVAFSLESIHSDGTIHLYAPSGITFPVVDLDPAYEAGNSNYTVLIASIADSSGNILAAVIPPGGSFVLANGGQATFSNNQFYVGISQTA